ncbi:Biotin transporter BioY [Aquicella siphonis]|uniref:Biotin transporter n=1 Tax=Aquicella siphonis TaxID=254247 RepID=A0A5E4PLM1_9COXI|nr:biotin transporter BioY [Aquicella siphonis]VVC77301.1 Biotin transporter BioY [Aquicella siphonis]
MTYSLSLNTPMQSIFCSKQGGLAKQVLLVITGVLVLAFSSQLSIPLMPVPLTFQSTTVVLIGMAYGPRNGSYVIMAYLLAGICGIPVFADFSAGISKLYGPTMGYLIGFLPAAFLSGYLAQKGFAKNIYTSFVAACLGVSVIFFLGVTILAQYAGLRAAIEFGLVPFLLSEPIKLIAVACVIPKLWKRQ